SPRRTRALVPATLGGFVRRFAANSPRGVGAQVRCAWACAGGSCGVEKDSRSRRRSSDRRCKDELAQFVDKAPAAVAASKELIVEFRAIGGEALARAIRMAWIAQLRRTRPHLWGK